MNESLTKLLDHLHRGGQFAHWWTPDSGKFYTDRKTGEQKQSKFSAWFPVGRRSAIPAAWRDKNVYFCVHPQSAIPQKARDDGNVTDQKYVKAWVSHVAAVNCFFAEYDVKDYGSKEKISAHLRTLPLYPSVVIDSGGGFHCYWLLANTVTVTDDNRNHIKRLQYAWVKLVGSDDDAKDLARVLRVPGTLNRKEKYAPNYPTVTIMEADYGRLYSMEEFEQLTEHLRQEKPRTPYSGSHSVTDDLVTAAENLKRLSPSRRDRYQEWMNVGFALKGLGNAGLQLWDEWSRGSTNYTEGCCDAKWDRMSDTGLGLGSLVKWANDDDPAGKRTYTNGANGHAAYTNGHSKPVTASQPVAKTSGVECRSYETMLSDLRAKSVAGYDDKLAISCLFDSEEGDARLLHSILAGHVVYDHIEGQWYWYNNLYWEPDKTWNIYQLTSDVLSEVYKQLSIQKHAEAIELEKVIHAADEPTQEQRDNLKKINTISKTARARAGKLNEINEVKRVLNFASSGLRLGITGNEWDALPYVLPVRNGVIDLKTGTMIPPAPEQYIRTFAPVDFAGLDTPAVRFEQFLTEIFAAHPDLPNYIWRLFGYAISGTSSEHTFPIFWGAEGRNGKDTLLNAVQAVLGTDLADSVSNDVVLEAKGHRTAGAATPHLITLRGKRLAWASEPDEGARVTPGLVKMITGGGRINARRPHDKNEVSFQPTHTLLLLTNHAPHAPSDDSALWERVKLIEFTQRFLDEPDPQKPNEHKKDPTLKEKLEAEKPGILAWLVRGCLEYQRVGLTPPDCVKFATSSYRNKEDTLQLFIDERCIIRPDASTKAQTLYNAYKDWCLQMNLRPMTGTSFGEKIAKKFTKDRKTLGIFYLGIGILADNPT